MTETDFAPSPWWLLKIFKTFFDVCPKDPTFDGLKIPWMPLNYCNPPYSNKIPWINKAIAEAKKGNMTVMLIPEIPDAAWFHDLVIPNARVFTHRGRLELDDGKHTQYASMLAIFTGKK